jgi:hypothetical protein
MTRACASVRCAGLCSTHTSTAGGIVERSITPFLDGARHLLVEGFDPATPLIMRHAGQDYDALRSTVGAAANLSTTDAGGKPRFVKWQPNRFRDPEPCCGTASMRQNQNQLSEEARSE